MKRIRLKTKDGRVFYGDPYVENYDINARKYILNNKSYYKQDLDECMKALNKNGLGLLDVVDYAVESVEGKTQESELWKNIPTNN